MDSAKNSGPSPLGKWSPWTPIESHQNEPGQQDHLESNALPKFDSEVSHPQQSSLSSSAAFDLLVDLFSTIRCLGWFLLVRLVLVRLGLLGITLAFLHASLHILRGSLDFSFAVLAVLGITLLGLCRSCLCLLLFPSSHQWNLKGLG